MDIKVKKCDRCGKIYNIEERKITTEINPEEYHYLTKSSVFEFYYEGSNDKLTDFYSIIDADNVEFDFCHDCALKMASSIKNTLIMPQDSHKNCSI